MTRWHTARRSLPRPRRRPPAGRRSGRIHRRRPRACRASAGRRGVRSDVVVVGSARSRRPTGRRSKLTQSGGRPSPRCRLRRRGSPGPTRVSAACESNWTMRCRTRPNGRPCDRRGSVALRRDPVLLVRPIRAQTAARRPRGRMACRGARRRRRFLHGALRRRARPPPRGACCEPTRGDCIVAAGAGGGMSRVFVATAIAVAPRAHRPPSQRRC